MKDMKAVVVFTGKDLNIMRTEGGSGYWHARTDRLNDADAAGVAEMTYGAGRGRKGVVMILTFGTGTVSYTHLTLPTSDLV